MRYRTVEFYKRLKALRIGAGLTQQQLADQIGVSKSVISYYEQQDRAPSPDTLIRLASTFHVTTDYLLGIDKTATIDVSGLDANDIRMISILVEHLRTKNAK